MVFFRILMRKNDLFSLKGIKKLQPKSIVVSKFVLSTYN